MISTYSKIGELHKNAGLENQDALFCQENSRFVMLALADGVSACKNSRQGAQTVCKEVSAFLLQNAEMFFQCKSVKISFLVLEQVIYKLKTEAEKKHQPLESYASTLIFCCIDKQKQTALFFNLGDGAVYCSDGNLCFMLLSPVCINSSLCPQILTKEAYKAAYVKKINLKNIYSFLICSDGLLREMEHPDHGRLIRNCIKKNSCEQLITILESSFHQDDISFIGYSRRVMI